MLISYFKKLPPSFSVPTFYVFITLMLVLRFLFGSAYGALVLTVAFYTYAYYFTSAPPLSPSELVLLIDGISSEYKVALLTSLVTVVGFVIAFHTATASWRNQMRAQLKAQVAGDIENFFAVVTSNMTDARIYVESLVDAVKKIQKGDSLDDARFSVAYLQRQAGEFLAARDRLSHASVEVHRLLDRSYTVLSTGWGILAMARLAADSLEKVTGKMWIRVPRVDLQNPDHIQSFMNEVNVSECNEFLEACEANYGKISGLSGGVRGYLIAPVFDFNLATLVTLLSDRKQFREAMGEFHTQLRKDD